MRKKQKKYNTSIGVSYENRALIQKHAKRLNIKQCQLINILLGYADNLTIENVKELLEFKTITKSFMKELGILK